MADTTVKDRCRRRLEGMKKNRSPFEGDWRQASQLAAPARSRFLNTDTNKGRVANRRLNNSHGIFAMRTLQGGMTSGLSSQSRPWFTLGLYDENLMENPEVKAWLEECEKRMYAFLALTNFYGAAKTGYLELGLFGTDACVMVSHDQVGMVCHPLTAGEYWIAVNDEREIGALYRDCSMSVVQAVQTFGKDKVSARIKGLYDKSQYDEIVQFYQAIEQNDDFVGEGKMGLAGKKWRSVYWDANDAANTEAISIKGFDEQPFWASRWDTTGNDAWGQGPGHDALPDLRELQLQTKRKAEATDMVIWPELISSTKAKLKRQPKAVTYASEIDVQKAVSVPAPVPYQTIAVVREDIADLKNAINEATFADLFMAITNMQGIQPRNVEEIASRNEEKLTQLGPVIERVNNEKLKVAIDRTFGIMQRMQMLPPAPDAMRGSPEIKITFVSILTQMQRMVGLGAIERTVSFGGSLMAMYPDARHKLDPMAIMDEYAERAGAPLKIIRSTEDAQADSEADAKQAQMAQAAEMASKMAPPIDAVTNAAKVAASVPANGTPAVQDLVPLLPRP